MSEQPALFPADKTTDQQCQVCGAVRRYDQDKAPACQFDIERDGKRPRGCLNAHDPRYADLPF